MIKTTNDTTLFNPKNDINKNLKTDLKKTTNVNILLNRVRLDKKMDLRKKIKFMSLLVSVISIVVILAII